LELTGQIESKATTMKHTLALLTALLLAPLAALQAAEVGNLRCEYLKDPHGIDVAKPRLSWVMESGERGQRQTAYQVLVSSAPEQLTKDRGDLWDSGKVASDQSVQVEYAGKPLASRTSCHWKVRVWDKEGKATEWSKPALWTMGLLKPEDWQAKWITHPAPKRRSHPWLRRTFELKEGVERAVIYINTASYYELHINGQKVGPNVLEPGITQNNKRFVVNAYDVTAGLVKGTNTIAVWMGPGWHQTQNRNTFNAPILRAQLTVETPSGPMQIGTEASWRVKESCTSQIGEWK
jgi:alpha-L-rhamnosidase